MRTIDVVVAFGCCLPALAQQGKIMSGSASRDDRVSFTFETRLEPPSAEMIRHIGGGVVGGKKAFHRYITLNQSKMLLGYDLVIEPVEPENTFRVSFGPPSVDALHLKDAASWSLAPLPRYPPPQTVRGGDTIVLDLMVNPLTYQKIVDYLVVRGDPRRYYTASGPAHAFTVADAEMRFTDPQLTVNGKLLDGTTNRGSVAGAVGWLYLADRGRFVFSLAPHEQLGFRKSGEVRGSTLSFTWGSDAYSLNCNDRIAPGSGAYDVYVFNDAGYRPKGGDSKAAFLFGVVDRAEYLIR
jgi:hypothetical protein